MESLDLASSRTIILDKLRKVTIQDLSIVLICASAIYLLRARDSYNLQPAWRWDLDTEAYANDRYPGPEEGPVTVVVTDLESDGEAEILSITHDFKLQVLLAPPKRKLGDPILPYAKVKQSVQLPPSSDGKMSRATTMTTGFIHSYNASDATQQRKQVIIVIREDQEVLCFTSDLQLLWRTSISYQENVNLKDVKAISVLVTSYAQQQGDVGSVYIGTSFYRETDTRGVDRQPPRMQQMGSHSTNDKHKSRDFSPFSIACLSGDTGQLRWKSVSKTLSRKTEEGVTQVHWTKLAPFFLSQMPHTWGHVADTRFDLLDMSQGPPSKDKHAAHSMLKPLEDIIGLEAHHIEGLPFGGLRPHSDHEHVQYPDTLVLHSHDGIQLMDIRNGNTVSQLLLREGKSMYVDLAAEGRVVRLYTQDEHCQAVADYFHPDARTKFIGPICTSASTSLWLQTAVSVHRDMKEDMHFALGPQVVPSVAKRGGIMNNLMGRTLRSEMRGYDSLFLTSSGRLTSFSPSGHVNWQALLSAKWCEFRLHSTLSAHGWSRDEQASAYQHAFTPSMTPLSMKVFGKKNLLLVMGWDQVSLVDLYDGYLLAEHSLPCPPMYKPVIEDFDADGHSDIIITCQFGYIGMRIERQASVLHTVVIGVVVVLTVLLLSWFCKPSYDEDEIRPYVHKHNN